MKQLLTKKKSILEYKRGLSVVGGGAAAILPKIVTVDNTSNAATLTNYPVRVDVTYSAGMQADFSDLRFNDSDDTTALSFWIESYAASTSAIAWVKVPSIPGSDSKSIHMHYGNISAAGGSERSGVFDLFDDFTDGLHGTTAYEIYAAPVTASVSLTGYSENIVFDDATNKFWWVFQQGTAEVKLASATTITGPWTAESAPLFVGNSPMLTKFGSDWYIYYGYGTPNNVYAKKSSTVNSGYSDVGISNPIISVGGSGTWDEARVLEPYCIKVGETYYLFYMGESVGTLIEKTGYATSSSPIGPFTKYAGNPVLSGDTGLWDTGQDKAADPHVFLKDGIYYIGVAGCAAGKAQWTTGFFKTTDFVTFTPCSPNPALSTPSKPTFRGGVTEVGGTYYFAYATGDGLYLTTLQFNADIPEKDTTTWTWGVSAGQAGGICETGPATSASNQIISKTTFGANYALRTRAKFSAASNTMLGFRNGISAGVYAELFANYGGAGKVHAYQKSSADANVNNIGNSGEYAVWDIKRRGTTSVIYAANDAAGSEIITQVPSNLFPVNSYSASLIDWILVRKFSYPEPTATVA